MAMRGVNLGGWLVLEKWITPSVFTGSKAEDEYTFCVEADKNLDTLRRHRETFITEADFNWLAQHGIEAVRLPVGYWILDGDEPLVGAAEYLDRAFAWAAKHDLKILLDLHGAPGSQNGWDHSGKRGKTGWTKRGNIVHTLQVLDKLAARYGKEPALWGIELLNEPRLLFDRKLRDYYRRGYEIVRAHCGKEVMVVIHDGFRPRNWNGFMSGPEYVNVALDTHLYQCFSRQDKHLSIDGHLSKARGEWADLFTAIDKPVIVGEWSLGLDPATFSGMDDKQKTSATKAYADAQLAAFNGSAGWFFWTYKTEGPSGWNFRHLLETGLIVL
jgi:glucan 1,3-beta-glucosidase